MISVQTEIDVQLLLDEHLSDMYAISPADSVHALDHSALADASVTFYTAREHGLLIGCGALKHLSDEEAEIKSMRTAAPARRRGDANVLLTRIIRRSQDQGLRAFCSKRARRTTSPPRDAYTSDRSAGLHTDTR